MDMFVGSTDIACAYGLDVAVFVHNIVYWVKKNAANRSNFIDGRYWTHNSMDAFAQLYPMWSKDQVKRIIAKARDHGLILIGEYNDNPYLRTKWYSPSDKLLSLYDIEISADGIWRNRHIEACEIAKSTCGEIATSNNVQDNTQDNPPIVPQRGAAASGTPKRKREPKKAPDWKPDRFAAFWAYYPRGEAKQAAIRAWDKLQPDDDLLAQMGRALSIQKSSDMWQAGIGIPYASTWLNNRRWEEVDLTDDHGADLPPAGSCWAPDPEVMG